VCFVAAVAKKDAEAVFRRDSADTKARFYCVFGRAGPLGTWPDVYFDRSFFFLKLRGFVAAPWRCEGKGRRAIRLTAVFARRTHVTFSSGRMEMPAREWSGLYSIVRANIIGLTPKVAKLRDEFTRKAFLCKCRLRAH